MLSRSEAAGVTVAVAAHVLLFGFLSLQYLYPPTPPKLNTDPIEVSMSDDVGLRSEAPVVSKEAPAAKLAAVEAPIEEEVPPETPPVPDPKPKPDPKPQPKPEPAPDAKPAKPTKPTATASNAKPAKPPTKPVVAGGRLDGILNGITDQPSKGTATTPPAAVAGPAVKASLSAELSRKIRPHWKAPTGADADKLKTVIRVALDKNGAITSIGDCKQTGITDSNRVQAALHCENAKRAVRLAAPFSTFPPEYYDTWKVIFPEFDWRLSQ